MTNRKYLMSDDTSCTTTVTATGSDETGSWVCTADTVCHPQGGGQQSDRGTLGGILLAKVIQRDGEIFHYLREPARFEVGQQVKIIIDEAWRKFNSRLHTAGHLKAAIVERAFPGLHAVKGHHFPGEAYVEFEGTTFPPCSDIEAQLSQAISLAVSEDLPVGIQVDVAGMRRVQIGDFVPSIPCGGTHLKSTGPIGRVKIRGVKVKGGKLRIGYDIDPGDQGCRLSDQTALKDTRIG